MHRRCQNSEVLLSIIKKSIKYINGVKKELSVKNNIVSKETMLSDTREFRRLI